MEHVTEQQLTRQQSPVWRALRAAAPQTIPVLAGYFVLGMGYGIYVQSLGLPVWMPMLMGTVVYGGSLEFVLASLLLSAFSPLSAFLMALIPLMTVQSPTQKLKPNSRYSWLMRLGLQTCVRNWQLTRMLLPQRMLTQLLWTVQAKWKEM